MRFLFPKKSSNPDGMGTKILTPFVVLVYGTKTKVSKKEWRLVMFLKKMEAAVRSAMILHW